MKNTIVIIDGNSLINRAYYAMRQPMITKDGIYTHGIYAFLNMFNKILKDYEPTHIAVAFDRKAPTFRHLEYEEYKAGRKKMPPELAMQLPLLKDILKAMNVKMLEMDGFEADDIIGTVAREAEAKDMSAVIITGDKDELQLVSDKTSVVITRKGITDFDFFDIKAMYDKYGFSPQQFIDYKGLMGDQSDNIPGVPGIGEKTASKLILEFGSIENILAKTEAISNANLRGKIEDNKQLAMLSKRLATINVNVPIDVDFAEYEYKEPNYSKLIDQYVKLEFNSFLKKMEKVGTAVPKDEVKQDEINIERQIITEKSGLDCVKEQILGEKQLVMKLLTSGNMYGEATELLYGIGIMLTNRFYYITEQSAKDIEELYRFICANKIGIIGHELKDDYKFILKILNDNNITESRVFNTVFDSSIAAYVLDPSKSNYSLKTLSYEYFYQEHKDEETFMSENGQTSLFGNNNEEYGNYCYDCCLLAKKFYIMFSDKLTKENLDTVCYDIEFPLIEVLADMEFRGIAVDRNEIEEIGKRLKSDIETLTTEIYEMAGETFNINSPSQLSKILFEKLELPSGKKTKSGYSTNAEALEKLVGKHPIAEKVLLYRTLTKLNGTYVEGLLPLIMSDGKIHAHFKQTVTTTGRISCMEPNLQNIPIRQELGRSIRKAFVPDNSDCCLVGADYSQIELKILAHISEDEELIEAFNRGDDIHRVTASKVFNVPLGDVTGAQRSAAKAVNFGVIYGMSSFGLSTEIKVNRAEADKYIAEYFKKYSSVKAYMDDTIDFCKKNGYVSTIMGRKRYIHEINASAYMVRQQGERLAMNSPIQGSAADVIKIAMNNVYTKLRESNLQSKLILQVHDELLINTFYSEEEQVKRLLRDCMEEAVDLRVKLTVDLNRGINWYELK